ncbi:MAG TPA: tetratricopeptide repeat protein [Gemmataceae bacterium]|jgi:tetratricopeptide (TPR) repeat protein|nr:tetratricopeptide repeat protein [Gemmataceae bacterium]
MSAPHFVPLLAALGDLPAELVVLLTALALVTSVAGGVGAWRMFGKGPRRHRAYKRARELVLKGNWQEARNILEEIRHLGPAVPEWQGRLNNLEGECLRAAGETALAERDYEDALKHHLAAAKLLGTNVNESRLRIVEGMLAELRHRLTTNSDEKAIKLSARILQSHPACAEAAFWQGLANIRLNRLADAQQSLRTAQELGEKSTIDPALYLGMLLVREGKHKEGLRYLAEANRAAPNSVLVNWQLGTALVVAGADATLAVRALQKATEGMTPLVAAPERFWSAALPEGSFIGRLSARHPFQCPILGGNVPGMLRQAKLALGQALVRLDRVPEAVKVFEELAKESEPTLPLLRALGMALCKLERFDEAYVHLRAAHEQDSSKNPVTVCYLAYCAVRAKPSRPEDRPVNVRWAVRLLIDVPVPVEAEPAKLAAQVFAQGRSLGIPVPVEDQLRLCDTLVALNITDPIAAAAFDQLAVSVPDAVRPPYAFLYGRAALLHQYRGERDLELLTRIFRHEELAREFYEARKWGLSEVEHLYLERWVERNAGFPDVFGPEYPARCEKNLLDRAKNLEEAGDAAGAAATVDLLRRLIPANALSFDRLAKLAWVRKEVDEAVRLLQEWRQQAPDDPTPLVRLAVIEQQRGQTDRALEYLQQARQRTPESGRVALGILGAKLTLKANHVDDAIAWLRDVLQVEPKHPEALWQLAALFWQKDDHGGLAELASAMDQPEVADPRFHYLATVCQITHGDLETAKHSARRVAANTSWQSEGDHLVGAVHLRGGDYPGAANGLEAALHAAEGTFHDHARALLGWLKFEQREYIAAARLWQQVSPEKRQAWGIERVLAAVTFLAGVEGLKANDPLAAFEWFTQARQQNWPDPRLSVLYERALVEASGLMLERNADADLQSLLPALDRASKSRSPHQLLAALLLARAYRKQDRLPEAREVLRRVSPPNAPILLQMALVAIQDRQLTQAEEMLVEARQTEPKSIATGLNLFWTRLSLGQTALALELLPGILELVTVPERRRLLGQLQLLLKGGPAIQPALVDLTPEEEQRLIKVLFSLGRLETAVPLLCQLGAARLQSQTAREAQTLGMLRLGKQRFDRGDWLGAERWLSPLAKAQPKAAVRNLLGCIACMMQDFASGILHLQEALRLAGDDPRIHQNLALAFTWQGDPAEADLCWGRYLGTMEKRLPRPPGFIDYREQLRFQLLKYLGNQKYEQEKWPEALAYLQEAQKLQPENLELTERLFLLQIQAGQREEARKLLTEMQALKPKHPPFEMYELDLIEVRSGEDLETLVETLHHVVEQLSHDPSVQDKAVTRVWPMLQYRSDQLTKVMREIREDLRQLPDDSRAWYEALRDLRSVKRDLRRLRQVTRYCGSLQVTEATRRKLEGLTGELERKIDYCRRWEDEDY